MRVQAIDLDGSLAVQPAVVDAARRDGGWIAAGDLGPRLRLWTDESAMLGFEHRVRDALCDGGRGSAVTFIGSGDFHHLTVPLMATAARPFTVVHFDNHPDWVRFAPRWHCGSWVNRALELPHVVRIVTIGPCSDDLDWPQFKGANLAALRRGRLELYPWRHAPSRIIGTFDDGPGHRVAGGRIAWRCVGEDWSAFVAELCTRIPTESIWITIDKDVLCQQDATTNWDQGAMPLSALMLAIEALVDRRRVLGVDVCGEYAPIRHRNLRKRFESWTDQPRDAGSREIAVNARTNAALLALLSAVAA
ncbi:arginase [Reyranella sp. CPCC 100927]|uniref:arginase n=1 Tax=Reyranella sp. CPCC 100927 TaxID=2599616 RepID=UPI0011B7E69A|nr:arginase [Reyranella sp. CPCC 100927]TWT05637.1 arginase [Reyranella sp. CPCC 100927]